MSQPVDPSNFQGRGSRSRGDGQLYKPSREEGDKRFRDRDSRSGGKYSGGKSGHQPRYNSTASSGMPINPPVILQKNRANETRSLSPVNHSPSGTPAKEQTFKVPSSNQQPHVAVSVPLVMTEPVKLLGEELVGFHTSLQDFLGDDQDFLVVGCVGSQWSGKSSLLSNLASSDCGDYIQKGVFSIATPGIQMKGLAATVGLDAFVTSDRVIWLDCQPLMSAALAEKELTSGYLKEYGKESPTLSNTSCVATLVEVQSLQLLSFLYCICHVLVVVQDSLADPNLIRLLQTAEMLKPNLAADDAQLDILPHLVTVYNRARPADLAPKILEKALKFHRLSFQKSRLGITSSGPFFMDGINFSALPDWDSKGNEYEKLIPQLKRAILALPRKPFNMGTTVLSEKSWLTFASKAWDAVRKSSLMMEYARLLQ